MVGSIYSWSKTAGQNDTSDGDIDWREGMFPDAVNNSGRQMMGRSAEFRDDITGTLTATGTPNALLITANSAFSSLANGRKLTFRAAAANTGPVSVNVNGLGSKKIRAMGASGDVDLAANDLKANSLYTIAYSATADGGTGAWILFAPFSKTIGGNSIDSFPAGTRLPFQQSTAPVGWVKDTTHDNKALRLVNSTVTTGGSLAFTTAFSSGRITTTVTQGGTVGGTAITAAQMPSHSHHVSGTTSAVSNDHTHTWGGTFATDVQGSHTHVGANGNGNWLFNGSGSATSTTSGNNVTIQGMAAAGAHAHNVSVGGTTSGISANHTHTYAAWSTVAGSDQPHTHTFTGVGHNHVIPIDVQYVDFIICEKAA